MEIEHQTFDGMGLRVLYELRERKHKLINVLARLPRYVLGYFPDLRIKTEFQTNCNPMIVKIEVYWCDEEEQKLSGIPKPNM